MIRNFHRTYCLLHLVNRTSGSENQTRVYLKAVECLAGEEQFGLVSRSSRRIALRLRYQIDMMHISFLLPALKSVRVRQF
jgi:hypothetical protein